MTGLKKFINDFKGCMDAWLLDRARELLTEEKENQDIPTIAYLNGRYDRNEKLRSLEASSIKLKEELKSLKNWKLLVELTLSKNRELFISKEKTEVVIQVYRNGSSTRRCFYGKTYCEAQQKAIKYLKRLK